MKSFVLILPLLGALVHAQLSSLLSGLLSCQCPLVKCDATSAVTLCNCLNSRETLCKARCPNYTPIYRPCPVSISSPNPTPTPTPTPLCECEQIFCIQAWPQSCYCANAGKEACYKKCGGPKPSLQSCPPLTTMAIAAMTRPAPTQTQSTSTPQPIGTHQPCGGFRSVPYPECKTGEICIKDPYKDGCGPACDQPGICVSKEMCGGFAGFRCADPNMVCNDLPGDGCDPKYGGADCGGVCVWPH